MEDSLKPLLEDLAEMSHKQWVVWTKDICRNIDEVFCKELESNWIDYKNLPEEVKDIYRGVAKKYINIVLKHCLCV